MRKFGLAIAVAAAFACAPARAQSVGDAPFLAAGLTNTVQTVKGSFGALRILQCYNPNASVAYVQVFDTTAAVTLGTTVPALSFGFPATSSTPIAANMSFLKGLKIAATTTAKGSTAPGSALDCNLTFK